MKPEQKYTDAKRDTKIKPAANKIPNRKIALYGVWFDEEGFEIIQADSMQIIDDNLIFYIDGDKVAGFRFWTYFKKNITPKQG